MISMKYLTNPPIVIFAVAASSFFYVAANRDFHTPSQGQRSGLKIR